MFVEWRLNHPQLAITKGWSRSVKAVNNSASKAEGAHIRRIAIYLVR